MSQNLTRFNRKRWDIDGKINRKNKILYDEW